MSDFVEVKKVDDERPIPTAWRKTFFDIVEALRSGNVTLTGLPNVDEIPNSVAQQNVMAVASYGDEIVSLPDESWQTSVCRWLDGHWEVLVDLFAKGEGLSDLVLFATVREHKEGFRVSVDSIHVP